MSHFWAAPDGAIYLNLDHVISVHTNEDGSLAVVLPELGQTVHIPPAWVYDFVKTITGRM